MNEKRAPLQPLRIPAGWSVVYHDLRECDPDRGREDEFREDLLQLVHAASGYLLDVGWYPQGDVEGGEFMVCVVRGDFEDGRVHEFRSRDRLRIVAEVEELLAKYGQEHGT